MVQTSNYKPYDQIMAEVNASLEAKQQEPPKHALTTRAEELLATDARLKAEIDQVRVDRRLSDEYRQKRIDSLEANRGNYLAGTQAEMVQTARSEAAQLKKSRAEIITRNRLADPLNEGNGVQNAAIELDSLAGAVAHFREFSEAYDAAITDPFLRRAFQIKGAAIARGRWPGEPGIGSFEKQLAADRQAAYEDDNSQAVKGKIGLLYEGVKSAASATREIYRQGTGMLGYGPQEGGSYHRELEELGAELAAELGYGTGASGGYMPADREKWVIEGAGGFLDPAA